MSDSGVLAILSERAKPKPSVLFGQENVTAFSDIEEQAVAGAGRLYGLALFWDPYSMAAQGQPEQADFELLNLEQTKLTAVLLSGAVSRQLPSFTWLLEAQFNSLAQEWRAETRHYSILARRYSNPAYQKIIGMGRRAVPFILRELEQRPDRWFDALTTLTGENPAQGARTFDEGVRAWVQWGKERSQIG